MSNRKSILLIILMIMVMALLLAACSSGEATEAPTDVPAQTPTEEAEPTAGAVDILPTAAEGEATLMAKENVRVRSGPGLQYPVYKKIEGGQTAKLLGVSTDGNYYAIEVPVVAPNTGWVDANFAEISNAGELPVIEAPPVPPTADFVGVQAGDPTIVADDVVFLHSGPGEQYPAYGTAEAGSKGLAIGVSEDSNWWVVRINPEVVGKGYGWVQKEFVTTENIDDDLPLIKTPPLPKSGELPPPDPNGPYGIATDYLNVRSGPGTYYTVMAITAPGASAEITGVSSDDLWWQVKVSENLSSDERAWVVGVYVDAYNTDNVPVVESPALPPTNPNPPEGAFSCILVFQSPEDGAVFEAGTPFNMTWEFVNGGEETWTTADTVISKVGAAVDQPLSEVDTLALTSDVETGDTYEVTVPMAAPDLVGQFGEYWIMTLEEETICYFYNVIQVQE